MDFEYQNGTGPMDARSPFAQLSGNAQRNQSDNSAKKRKSTSPFLSGTRTSTEASTGGWSSVFSSSNSPTKSFPSLREPASQPHFFNQPAIPSSPNKSLPALPTNARDPLFHTPRKLDYDFASSPEQTPKSLEHNDSDATPDGMGLRGAMSRFDIGSKPVFSANTGSPNRKDKDPGRRDTFFGRLGFGRSPVSGKGAIAKEPYSHTMEKRIKKKRSQDAQRERRKQLQKHVDESDLESGLSDMEGGRTGHELVKRKGTTAARKTSANRVPQEDISTTAPPPQKQQQEKGPHFVYSFFAFLNQHPNLPHILSYWAQLALNVFFMSGIIYIAYSFWSTIRSDVDKKSYEAIAEILAEMKVCADQWTQNRCDPDTRVPAMEVVCNNWEKCMNRDPNSVGRAKVSAHTFAEIFNSFIEPISYKAMVCLISLSLSLSMSSLTCPVSEPVSFGVLNLPSPFPFPEKPTNS